MNIEQYPCNRGTSMPVGWHYFQITEYGVVCLYCGEKSKRPFDKI